MPEYEKKDIEFVDGLIVKKPHERAPDFVKAAISIKRSALISWLTQRDDDWINLDVKESKKGSWYAAVNDFKPSKEDVTAQQNAGAKNPSGSNQGQQTGSPANQLDDFDDQIPF